jgi:hypothetical protein
MSYGYRHCIGSESGYAIDGILDPDTHCECGSGARRVKSAQKIRITSDSKKYEN